MRNIKKLVALTLTVAMLLSSFTVAFAAVSADATTSEALGVIKGSGDEGVTAEYLATTPTRKQAALMSLRLKGLEAEALAYTGEEKFDDQADVEAFWQPILSYLKANPELGWIGTKVEVEGVEKTNFNPDALMSGQAYLKVMLEALGFKQTTADVEGDFTWDEVFTFAATKGLTEPTGTFTVDALCKATVEALKATTADGAELYKSLFTDDQAVAAGLIPVPSELKAVSATMDNLAEVVITFNTDVDADDADLVGSYKVVDTDSSSDVKDIMDVTVDGNVVTLLITESGASVDQQENLTVTVKEAVGVAEDTDLKIVNVLDTTIPTVEKVVTSGPNSFEITFSEPLGVQPYVKLNNGAIFAQILNFTAGDSVVKVSTGSSLKGGTAYTVDVEDAEDYASYTMVPYSTTVTYEKVEAALTVSVKEVTEKYVVVVFSEDVTVDLDALKANFYHSFSSYAADSVTAVDGSATEYKVAFTSHFVPYAGVAFAIEADDIEDVWGNEMAADFTTTIQAVEDKEAPTLSIVEVSETKMTVEFSEEVTGATTNGNYVIKDADEDETNVTATAGDEDNQYVLTYSTALTGGTYTLEVKDIKDASLAENEMNPNPTILTFTVTDGTAPDLTAATAILAGTVVYVTYPEAMNDSVLDVDLYRGVSGSAIIPETAEFFGTSNEEVKLTFDEDAVLETGANKLVVGRVADASGNYVDAISTGIEIVAASTADILGLKTLTETTMMITVAGKVAEGIAWDAIAISEAGVAVDVASIDSVSFNDDGNTEIVVGLNFATTVAAAEVAFEVVVDANTLKTDKGLYVTDAAFGYATDGVAPSYVSNTTGVAATTVALTFDEALETTLQASMAFDLVIVVDGDTLTPVFDYTTTVSGSDLVIEFTADSDPAGLEMTIDTVDAPQYIQDVAGNEANKIGDALEFDVDTW